MSVAACGDDDALADVTCRPSRGGYDLPETCSGGTAECPPDDVLPAAVVCRPSVNTSCDPAESCDGVTFQCSADPFNAKTPRRARRLEREKGFEPSTSTLARLHSTTELLPRGRAE